MADRDLRIDKFLWFARFTKTRAQAQDLANAGHLRLDGRVVDKAHTVVRIGNILSFMAHNQVQAIKILALPPRRLSAPLATSCYQDLLAKPESVDAAGAAP